MTDRVKMRVVAASAVTDQIHHVAITSVDGAMPDFRAGQYVDFFFTNEGQKLRRSYSIATPRPLNGEVTQWDFYAALVEGGPGSRYLKGLKVGDVVDVGLPTGIFTLKRLEPRRLVLIATSTGVVPFRSMQRELEQFMAQKIPVTLVFGCHHAGKLLFTEEWHQWLEQYESFEFVPCFSRPQQADEHRRWGAIVGRVQVALERLPLINDTATFMLCGNPDMVEDVEAKLVSRGVDPFNILVESF